MTPFVLPSIIDLSDTPLELTPGTYSDLVTETLGTEDWQDGPSLSGIDNAAQLIAQMGNTLPGAQDAVDALNSQGAAIPNGGGSTFTDDLAAAQATMEQRYNDTTAAMDQLPGLLELPLAPAGYGYSNAPPVQASVDLGNVSISGKPVEYEVGYGEEQADGNLAGLQNVQLVNQFNVAADIVDAQTTRVTGDVHDVYTLVVTPLTVGKGTVQINWTTANQYNLTILTVTMTVVP